MKNQPIKLPVKSIDAIKVWADAWSCEVTFGKPNDWGDHTNPTLTVTSKDVGRFPKIGDMMLVHPPRIAGYAKDNQPEPTMKPHYYVYNSADQGLPKVQHNTLESAKKEAERLAGLCPGKVFEILKCVAFSQTSKANTFWMDGEKPEDIANAYEYK